MVLIIIIIIIITVAIKIQGVRKILPDSKVMKIFLTLKLIARLRIEVYSRTGFL